MNIRKIIYPVILLSFSIIAVLSVVSCDNNDEEEMKDPELTGDKVSYELFSVSDASISGTATFEKRDDNSTLVTLSLDGTSAGGSHPAHIHMNTAAEGGGISISLSNVDGSSGESETIVNQMDDGATITYDELIQFDGYINVHLSSDDLATLIAQGDIGQNALTGEMESYDLFSVSDPSISGTAHFKERSNAETLVEINLEGTSGGEHPSHIHVNTAAEGGGIAISLTNVEGTSGISKTNVTEMDDETPVTYSELIEFDGYINVHLSSDDLATLIAQGDIGQNALTGEMESYDLFSVSDPSISGTAHFKERRNEETLLEIELEGTTDGGDHPAHIHANTAAEGGGIAISLTNIDGASGSSKTNIAQMDDETPVTYSELIEFDGYINVHLSSEDLATLIAQGDIGQNALTGNSMEYDLASVNADNISGSVKFEERNNGTTLVTVMVDNTVMGDEYPNHIHENSTEEGGGVAISLNNIDGDTGVGKTQVSQMDDATEISYSDLIGFNGHVKVHDPGDIGIIVAEGNIGSNAN